MVKTKIDDISFVVKTATTDTAAAPATGLVSSSFFIVHCCCTAAAAATSSTCISSIHETKSQLQMLRQRTKDIFNQYHYSGTYYGIPFKFLDENDNWGGIMRKGDTNNYDEDDNGDDAELLLRKQYFDEFETIGRDVEEWAMRILREDVNNNNNKKKNNENENENEEDDDGWTEIHCSKVFLRKISSTSTSTNSNNDDNDGRNNNTITITAPVPKTKQYVKWLKDSRGPRWGHDDDQYHPLMKLYATINAPLPIVCRYLSDKKRYAEYNSLIVDQKDLEVLAPHSKICWSQTKKLLFIEPRDFVTYCRHKWLDDGTTQFITNQACEYTGSSNNNTDSSDDIGGGYRAYSLRGATLISPCSKYPNDRTRIIILSHCNCGRDVPEWAVRMAVGIMAPIKPFEIIHRIELGIQRSFNDLVKAEQEAVTASVAAAASDNPTNNNNNDTFISSFFEQRSLRPAGIAQMGYAAFWPEGGGLVE